MSTEVGSAEAARLLGVSTATLYAYVSRGRIARRRATDGRTSLFSRDEIEALARRSRRAPVGPPPTIDVRVTSSITRLDEGGVSIRGHDLAEIVTDRRAGHRFEAIAELLWSGTLEHGTSWPAVDRADRAALDTIPPLASIARLAVAAHVLDLRHPGDDSATAARRLLRCAPHVLGARRATGSLAHRLTSAWLTRPDASVVEAIDTALALLADHELASSTLAVRIAASVRSSPYQAIAAGLAVVAGPLHGRAAADARRFIAECAEMGPAAVVARLRSERRRVPGFGHKVYRDRDPRFEVLLEAVRSLGDLTPVDEAIVEVGRTVPIPPNIDLALGALMWRLDLDADTPLFAVARIAGWAAHHAEELEALPLRYRGMTT